MIVRDAPGTPGAWERHGPLVTSEGLRWLTPERVGLALPDVIDSWRDAPPPPEVLVAALAAALDAVDAVGPNAGAEAGRLVVEPDGHILVDAVQDLPSRGLPALARYLARGILAHAPHELDPSWVVELAAAEDPSSFLRELPADPAGWRALVAGLQMPAGPVPTDSVGAVLTLGSSQVAGAVEEPPGVVNARFASLALLLGLCSGWMVANSWIQPVVEIEVQGAERAVLRCSGSTLDAAPPRFTHTVVPGRCTLVVSAAAGEARGEVDMSRANRYLCRVSTGKVECSAR